MVTWFSIDLMGHFFRAGFQIEIKFVSSIDLSIFFHGYCQSPVALFKRRNWWVGRVQRKGGKNPFPFFDWLDSSVRFPKDSRKESPRNCQLPTPGKKRNSKTSFFPIVEAEMSFLSCLPPSYISRKIYRSAWQTWFSWVSSYTRRSVSPTARATILVGIMIDSDSDCRFVGRDKSKKKYVIKLLVG